VNTNLGCIGGGEAGAYRISAEFGHHLTQRHDGLVIGARQVFLFASKSAGMTEVRAGWDFAIPIKQYEVTVAPYAAAGAAYGFSGGNASFALGFGAEGKFFFLEKLYAFAIPIELGTWIRSGFSGIVYQLGAGIGYAF
jgi:hypothetical protein